MASWITGSGKFGVKIQFNDGDVEHAYRTNKRDRDKLYSEMKKQSNVKHVDRINR